MLASSSSSSSIAFVPRQIMLGHNSAAAKEDGKERRKEKKDKKKRCSDTLELDRADAGSQPTCKRQGRDVLLRSIAAFLDSNGFSRTLSMLLSEAELQSGCWKSSTVNLESLFCNFLGSSNDITEGNISLLCDQESQKVIITNDNVMDHSSEKKTDKKKRKRKDQVDGIQTETNKEGLSSEVADLAANELAESHEKYKEEKKKNKVLTENHDEIAEPNDSRKLKEMVKAKEEELVSLTNDSFESSKKIKSEKKKDKKLKQVELESENTSKKKSEIADLSVDELTESHEKYKGEKKKSKVLTEIHNEIAERNDSKKPKEMVKSKEEELVSLTNDSFESSEKMKSGKKKDKKVKEMVIAKEEELVSLTNDSFESSKKIKSEKKKDKKIKQVELESENTSKKKSNDINLVDAEGHICSASEDALDNGCQDKIKKKKKSKSDVAPNLTSDQAGGENVSEPVVTESQDLNTKGAKKTSKKRKVSDLGEKSDVGTASKVSKVKSEGAENNEELNLVMFNKSTVDSDTEVITKEEKMQESKESVKVTEKQLDLSTKSKENVNESNSKNEVLAAQLENASIGKTEKCPAEPKSDTPFQRVKIDGVKYADDRLKDNSYWAKDGADIGYGAKAQEVLGQVRGRGFRHEKTKKKRGSYQGGLIDQGSHSIKFDSSDSE